jgi:hypothetical protein
MPDRASDSEGSKVPDGGVAAKTCRAGVCLACASNVAASPRSAVATEAAACDTSLPPCCATPGIAPPAAAAEAAAGASASSTTAWKEADALEFSAMHEADEFEFSAIEQADEEFSAIEAVLGEDRGGVEQLDGGLVEPRLLRALRTLPGVLSR